MLNRTAFARTIAELNDLSPAGFAIALHISFTAPAFLFQTYPQAWSDEYSARGLHLSDPTVAWGFSNTGAVRWSEIEAQDRAGVFARARAFGILYGVTVAVQSGGSRSLASFSRADREFTDAEIDQIAELLGEVHDETAGGVGLSAADRAALKAMSIRLTHS